MNNQEQPAAMTQASVQRISADTQSAARAILRCDHIGRVFVDGVRTLTVLTDVSLTINSGQVAALIGRSGSGKSTLLHILGLLDRPDAGEVLIDNTPAGNLSESDRSYLRNQHIGFVFQHYFLLPEFNVVENVVMPAKVACSTTGWISRRAAYTERAMHLLDQMGLKDRATQRVGTLSGGERQRVTLARALILKPKLLLCDEPTGNLDPETGTHIMNLIFEQSRSENTAVLLVTHDQSLASRAQNIFRLEQGVLCTEKEV
jgi:lipoprotein-releasing system ATP-binding protein